jgi:DUF1680 family protein
MLDTSRSPFAHWRSLPLTAVQISEGFWSTRQRVNRDVSLMHGFRMLREAGNLRNLQLAAGSETGAYSGPVFMDWDVYKWLEAVAYVAVDGMAEELHRAAEQAIGLVEAAQQADGYLDSYYQVVAPDRKWLELNTGHELYCLGHLIQAAVASHTLLADDRLLRVSECIIQHVTSIVELYRATRDRTYLELAQFFVDHRGRGVLGIHALAARRITRIVSRCVRRRR